MKLLKEFRDSADPCRAFAARWYGVAEDAVTAEMRHAAKALLFADTYAARGLGLRDVSPKEDG